MLSRKSPYGLLAGAAGVSVILITFASAAYKWLGTSTYHPPATYEVRSTESALSEAGFETTETISLAKVMSPKFVGDEALATGTWLSHSVRDSKKHTTVHASIAIVGAEAGEARPPLNLSLVFDRSGSMQGDKMHYATAAGHALVDALGPNDRISIVSYSTEVQTHKEPVNVTNEVIRGQLHDAIRSISCSGNTNLSSGFERGQALVEAGKTTNSINRVILLSDGQANAGVTNVEALRRMAAASLESGVSLTTMGVGVDYDEHLMNSMAVSGAGNYYFIERGASTRQVLARELDRLQSAVARDTRLLLQPRAGVSIIDVVGFEHRRDRDSVTVPLDAFSASERKDVFFELAVQPGTREALFDVELVYSDVARDRPVRRADTVNLPTAPGEEKIEFAMAKRLQQIETTKAFDQAIELYNRGERDAAADIIDRQREANQQFLRDHRIVDAGFARVDREFTELAESMRRLNRHSREAKSMVKKFHEANASVKGEVSF